jgi:hypothetical protein
MPSDLPTAHEYAALFEALRPRLTDNQLAMLRYHAEQARPVTATELANHVGYADWRGVNIQYGRVGKMLRELDPRLQELEGQESHAFASFHQIPRKDESYPEWIWTFHRPVEDALQSLPWVSSSPRAG